MTPFLHESELSWVYLAATNRLMIEENYWWDFFCCCFVNTWGNTFGAAAVHLNCIGDVPARIPCCDFVLRSLRIAGFAGFSGSWGGRTVSLVMTVSCHHSLSFPARPYFFHSHPMSVLVIQTITLGERYRFLIRGRLEAEPRKHTAHLPLGFMWRAVHYTDDFTWNLVPY